jgi:prepilin-type N-terminal cleavage/methylation domain-containing protein
VLHARSRDLSTSGILLSAPGARLPAGTDLRLAIVHPSSGESLDVAGRVVRYVDGRGAAAAVAIRFDAGAQRDTLERFVEQIRCVHQERQQAGLFERLDERGIAAPLKLLAAAVPAARRVSWRRRGRPRRSWRRARRRRTGRPARSEGRPSSFSVVRMALPAKDFSRRRTKIPTTIRTAPPANRPAAPGTLIEMRSAMKRAASRGFTLIELLVVIAIIGSGHGVEGHT